MSDLLVSAYTPTNNEQYLEECYNSLVAQTYNNWEWVVVPNGPNKAVITSKLNELTSGDKRVKICSAGNLGSVGALKFVACSNASGDLLAELDHDDYLFDTCFDDLVAAHEATGAGFLYSDWVSFRADGSFEIFSSDYGWINYSATYQGKHLRAQGAFPPTARSLCEVFFAPNHIRCWHRDAYNKAGGYDPSLRVGDDHELMCRTYLAGTEFHHIQKPLYFYRIHQTNTVRLLNAEIQAQQAKNRDKYIHSLILEECKRTKSSIVQLGEAGIRDYKPDVVLRPDFFTYGWLLKNIKDDSVGCVIAMDFLQLVPRECVVYFMKEIYRVLKPGGWLLAAVPSTDGRGAFADPRHVSYWNENSWAYYTHKQQATCLGYETDEAYPKFQQVRCWTEYPSDWHKVSKVCYTYADLCALKGQRQPGTVEL